MKTEHWIKPPESIILEANQVDIWRLSLDLMPDSVKSDLSSLSADEVERSASFKFDKDKHSYIVSHMLMRNVLSRYVKIEPAEIVFETNPHGKPFIKDSGLDFNISHSGEWVLLAATSSGKIGIDIERIRQGISSHVIARQYFSPGEIKELQALPVEEDRVAAFFVGWSRKEAYIKAHGLGLALPLESFDVSFSENPPLLRATRPDAEEAKKWALRSVEVDPAYKAAVAIDNTNKLEYRFWNWNS